MESIFDRHQILPSDDGYEYDERQEFEPDDESSWGWRYLLRPTPK